MNKKLTGSIFLFFITAIVLAQTPAYTCCPTNWWVGMKNPNLQLLCHIKDIRTNLKNIELNYPGVTIKKISKPGGDNYIFVDLAIAANTKPGTVRITINRVNGQ